ncbi:alpha-1,6-mannosylglycoprotein 6-beta-N-acetylglucosaminyltransferase B isoform 1 [Camelus ferus]|nr:alpha-1,6-mannosylglycoprotein 6-beta-N-acetylglucosaminyltransferase B isoform 1 [Camelus ferus]
MVRADWRERCDVRECGALQVEPRPFSVTGGSWEVPISSREGPGRQALGNEAPHPLFPGLETWYEATPVLLNQLQNQQHKPDVSPENANQGRSPALFSGKRVPVSSRSNLEALRRESSQEGVRVLTCPSQEGRALTAPARPVAFCRLFVLGIGLFSLCFLMTSLGGQLSARRPGDSPFTIRTEVMGGPESRGVLRKMSDLLELMAKRMDTLARLENSSELHRAAGNGHFAVDRSPAGAGLMERIQAIAQNVSDIAVKVDQILRHSLLLHSKVGSYPGSSGPFKLSAGCLRAHPTLTRLEDRRPWGSPSIVGDVGSIRLGGPTSAPSKKSRVHLPVSEGRRDQCEAPSDPKFPDCSGKVEWMRARWTSDPCYAFFGVDGTECSFLIYLSEVEWFCPPLPWRNQTATQRAPKPLPKVQAVFRSNLSHLLELMGSGKESLIFMKKRTKRLTAQWALAAQRLAQKLGGVRRDQKQILVHIGFLTEESGDVFSPRVLKGGPLGEMVQWADILAALYVLGHGLRITVSLKELQSLDLESLPAQSTSSASDHLLGPIPCDKSNEEAADTYLHNLGVPPGRGSCPLTVPLPFDLVYTDYHGLQQMKQHMGLSFKKYRCRIRVIDTFGTEPAYNHEEYATLHGYRTNWGYWNLNPKQFMTMFPHTPDNSFMGFVSEELNETEKQLIKGGKASNMAVVYGKEASIWKGKEKFLSILNKYMEIHGTVYYESQRPPEVPAFVKNHGLLPQPEFQQLLRKAKLFIGFGFPYEGPAPLEAIANGCVFLQSRFSPPHSSLNHEFFRGKPTSREVFSQHPYAENFIGKPHVWTVDYNNSEEFEAAIKAIMRTQVDPYLPYEYTCEGMLERIHAYIQHQDFCTAPGPAPPGARAPQSPFILAPNAPPLELQVPCDSTESGMNHLYPAFGQPGQECFLQKEPLLFSCAGSSTKYRRLCPCRDFRKGQVALCRACSEGAV